MLRNEWRQILNKSSRDLARNVARSYMIVVPLCALLVPLRRSFFDLIFAFHTNVSNFFLIFAFQVVVRLIFEIINVVTMQPINLPLISQSLSSDRSTKQQQNLLNAITSEDDLLRVSQLNHSFETYLYF